jgi:hypothetical protein
MQEVIIQELESAYEESRKGKGSSFAFSNLSLGCSSSIRCKITFYHPEDGEDLLIANPNHQKSDESDEGIEGVGKRLE